MTVLPHCRMSAVALGQECIGRWTAARNGVGCNWRSSDDAPPPFNCSGTMATNLWRLVSNFTEVRDVETWENRSDVQFSVHCEWIKSDI